MSAFKRIMILILALAISVVCAGISFAETDDVFDVSSNGSGITDTDGYITIKGTLKLDGGIPVTIMIAPQILDTDGETDITAERIEAAETLADFLSVVEYTETFTLAESGKIDLDFYVKDSMKTGIANVYISYNGGENLCYIGYFEHVGKDDVNILVGKFNGVSDAETAKTTYPTVIAEDMEELEVLRKIGADTESYTEVNDKTEFAQLLFGMKPDGDFTPTSLVESFNKAIAWMQLRESSDTLGVLNKYNNVFWNVELGEESDLSLLPSEERKNVLTALKNGDIDTKEALEATFIQNIGLANFRIVTDRNALSELLENDKYAVCFAAVNYAVSESGINEYELIKAYNYILEKNDKITTLEKLSELFEDAVDYAENGSSVGSGGSSGSGGGSGGSGNKKTDDVVLKVPSAEVHPEDKEGFIKAVEHPFKDITADHWANEYITEMYKSSIIAGKTADSFVPDEKINRQDFVKLIVSALKMETVNKESIFSDVEKGGYYEPFIMTAVENGIINGISESEFGMSNNIKREDAALIISRIAEGKVTASEDVIEFADGNDIASYAQSAVDFCAGCSIFKGDTENRFNPKNGLSRAEAAVIISRLMERIR